MASVAADQTQGKRRPVRKEKREGEASQKGVVVVRQEVTGPAARVRSSGSQPPPSATTALQTAQEEVAAAERAYEGTAPHGKKAMTSPQSREGAAGQGF